VKFGGGRWALAEVESAADSMKLKSPQMKVSMPGSAESIALRRLLLKAKFPP
jgi:hypothetical protein